MDPRARNVSYALSLKSFGLSALVKPKERDQMKVARFLLENHLDAVVLPG